MDKERIEVVGTVADRIAEYIQQENDKGLFKVFLYGKKGYAELRFMLIRADHEAARNRGPLFSLEEFVAVFDDMNDRSWWMMARDLMLIRMIERLHALGWIQANREVLVAPKAEEDEE